jgi:hypothetical protein
MLMRKVEFGVRPLTTKRRRKRGKKTWMRRI